jgi:centrosomal protein CEP104
MNTSKEYSWIPFHVVACSSEDYQSPADYLSIQQYNGQKAWESSRTSDFPVEIILRFHFRVQIDHILIGTKYDKGIP